MSERRIDNPQLNHPVEDYTVPPESSEFPIQSTGEHDAASEQLEQSTAEAELIQQPQGASADILTDRPRDYRWAKWVGGVALFIGGIIGTERAVAHFSHDNDNQPPQPSETVATASQVPGAAETSTPEKVYPKQEVSMNQQMFMGGNIVSVIEAQSRFFDAPLAGAPTPELQLDEYVGRIQNGANANSQPEALQVSGMDVDEQVAFNNGSLLPVLYQNTGVKEGSPTLDLVSHLNEMNTREGTVAEAVREGTTMVITRYKPNPQGLGKGEAVWTETYDLGTETPEVDGETQMLFFDKMNPVEVKK